MNGKAVLHRNRSASALAIHADLVARRLWRGLLPPPPRLYGLRSPITETLRLQRWCTQWRP